MIPSKRALNLSICILSGLLWGLNDVFTREVGLQVMQNALFKVIVFSLLLSLLQDSFSSFSILGYKQFKKNFPENINFSKKIFFLLFIAAIFAGPLGMCTAIIGIDFAGPVYAGAVTASYPIITFLFALILTKEKTTIKKTLGTFIAVIAITAIAIEGVESKIVHLTLGLMFAGIAMVGWGMESVLLDIVYRHSRLDTSFLLGLRQCISSISYIIILFVLFAVHGNLTMTVEQTLHHSILLFVCILTASTSYLTYYYSIKSVGPSMASLFNATFVFWDAIFAWILGLGAINNFYWVWAGMLVLGIYLVEIK